MIEGRSIFKLTPAVKGILIANVAIFILFKLPILDWANVLGLHIPQSQYFMPHQFVTYMFSQQSFSHLFTNMFAVFMFGKILEQVWGTKRFLLYFFVTGLGAALIHLLICGLSYQGMAADFEAFQNTPDPALLADFLRKRLGKVPYQYTDFIDAWSANPYSSSYIDTAVSLYRQALEMYRDVPTIGASGAVFGLLLAFGMLFPNAPIYIYFIAPIKAKYFVFAYAVLEFFYGLQNASGDHIAHFAHLGGMLFGLILILYWRRHR